MAEVYVSHRTRWNKSTLCLTSTCARSPTRSDVGVICFSSWCCRWDLKADTLPDGLLGLEELRHRDNGIACQSVCLTHWNKSAPPSNKRVEKAMTGHHSCGIMRSTKCEPTVTHCKEANFLMYRWETSLRAYVYSRAEEMAQSVLLSCACFMALQTALTIEHNGTKTHWLTKLLFIPHFCVSSRVWVTADISISKITTPLKLIIAGRHDLNGVKGACRDWFGYFKVGSRHLPRGKCPVRSQQELHLTRTKCHDASFLATSVFPANH